MVTASICLRGKALGYPVFRSSMPVAVCDFGKSQLESISAASLSGMSVSLATGISQIQQLQHVTAPEAGGEVEEQEEGKAGAVVCGREGGEREADGGAVQVEGVQNGQRLVTKSGARPPVNVSTISPSTTTSEGIYVVEAYYLWCRYYTRGGHMCFHM